jgi:UDP-GlcNAc:undecaprenyl-phosphate GlcNAc-1-phosphate transferase
MQLIVAFIATFIPGMLLTLAVRRFARQRGIVAQPREDRWHQKPTALLGGIAIYGAFLLGWLALGPKSNGMLAVMLAGTALFVLGLIDDLKPVKPYIRLGVQLALAAAVVYSGLKLPWTQIAVINDLITIFWLVGITNAINLLDNMDGLAAGITLISCVFLAVTFIISGQFDEAMIPLLLGGAVAGFLVFNFNPASIFMGDCGSTFLGFALGGTALLSDYGRTRNLTAVLFTPVLILMIPILDTCLVTVTRKLHGRSVAQGGRDHTSHRLVALGMTERRAVLMLYLFATVSGALALLVRRVNQEVILLLIPAFALVVLFLGMYLGMVRVYEEGAQPAGNAIIRGIWDFGYKRRIFEVLLDVVLVAMAYYGAYLIRFDGVLPQEHLTVVLNTIPLVIVIQVPFFLVMGVYRGLWRYTGISDLMTIAKAVLCGTAFSTITVLLIYNFRGPSRGASILYGLLLLLLMAASRLSFRMIPVLIGSRTTVNPNARPVLIYGASDSGEMLIREILSNPAHNYRPVGFVDEDDRMAGKVIHGYRIFEVSEMPAVIREHGVHEVLIPGLRVSESLLDDLRSMGVSPRRMSIRFE